MLSLLRAAAAVLIAMLAAGCAATPGRTLADDRWEGLNRGVYKFNDTVDRAALKPVARGYQKITPHWMRVGIGNFLGNLEYPATVVNQFLQGKARMGLRDTGRFLLNSTLGVAGRST
jgi:phospholipid-binding lipoprotein MlaA